MPHSPLIAIPLRRNPGVSEEYLKHFYAEAVHRAGGIPFLVPLIPEEGHIRGLLAHAGGVCLSGSNSDVDPALYGAPAQPRLGPVQPLRDRTDALLIEEALRRKLPILAICYGTQRLNVHQGGTLIQDLPSEGFGDIDHSDSEGDGHSLRLDADALPATLGSLRDFVAGWPERAEGGGRHFHVNTSHHQAVRTPGQGLTPFAWAPDGVVEGLVMPGAGQFVLAVQWHPEAIPGTPLSRAIFRAFVEACRRATA